MKKRILFFGIIFNIMLINNICAQENSSKIKTDLSPPIQIPERVVYNVVSEDENKIAIKYITDLIYSDRIINAPPRVVAIGPRLWRSFSQYEAIAGSPTIQIEMKVPLGGQIHELTGGAVRFEERTFYVMKIFKDLFYDQEITIRKMNPRELDYYWTMSAYDLTEPLFTIETKEVGKYIFDFEKGEIFYIEDISGLE